MALLSTYKIMKITEINIYPIKSLSGISVQNSIVEDRGLRNDRRFMLVDENNDLLTQRNISKMATIDVELKKNILEISTNGFETLKISNDFGNAQKIKVRVWNSFCDALVAEDEINKWFSEVLETNCRLVQMPETTKRRINEKFNKGDDIVSFADGYPLLIIGENSLKDLNSKLEKQIPMNRFRPNLVFSDSEAFAEDEWKKIKIGDTIFRITKPCARCVVTTIDQKTGISDVQEPLKTLAAYRKSCDVLPETFEDFGLNKNDVLFGQNLVSENFGEEIRIGDAVEIIE